MVRERIDQQGNLSIRFSNGLFFKWYISLDHFVHKGFKKYFLLFKTVQPSKLLSDLFSNDGPLTHSKTGHLGPLLEY
jgi:hypothetical protein